MKNTIPENILLSIIFLVAVIANLIGLKYQLGQGLETVHDIHFASYCLFGLLIITVLQILLFSYSKYYKINAKSAAVIKNSKIKNLLLIIYIAIATATILFSLDIDKSYLGLNINKLKGFVIYGITYGTLLFLIYRKQYWAFVLANTLILLNISTFIFDFNSPKILPPVLDVLLPFTYVLCLYLMIIKKDILYYLAMPNLSKS